MVTCRLSCCRRVVIWTVTAACAALTSRVASAQDAPSPAGPGLEPLPELAPPSPHAPPLPPVAPVPRAPPPPVPYTPAPEPEPSTLAGGREVAQGGYIAPEAKLTSLAGSPALLLGAQAGWLVNHILSIGGGGYALAGDVASPDALQTPGAPRANLSLAYGGARLAFIPRAQRAVHVVIGVLIGAGRASSSGVVYEQMGGNFFVAEPDVAVEASIARPLRIALGASYRITGGTSVTALTPTNLNGPTAFLALKVGMF